MGLGAFLVTQTTAQTGTDLPKPQPLTIESDQYITSVLSFYDPAMGKVRVLATDTRHRVREWDGTAWPIIGHFEENYGCGARAMFRADNGYLYIGATNCSVLHAAIHRSTDGGSTWQRVADMNVGAGAEQIWHFDEDSLGYLYAQEYGQALSGDDRNIRLWQSRDNGLTWQVVFTAPAAYRHLHLVHVDSTDRVWVTAGDYVRAAWYSDDHGATWVQVAESEAWITAVEADGWNYWGADWPTMGIQRSPLGWASYSQAFDIPNIQDFTSEDYLIFQLRRFDSGVWMAASLGKTGTPQQHEMLVSPDGRRWGAWTGYPGVSANIADFTAVALNGYVLAWSDSTGVAYWVRVPTMAEAESVAARGLKPVINNLVVPIDQWTLAAPARIDPIAYYEPTSLTLPAGGQAESPLFPVTSGQQYIAHARVQDDVGMSHWNRHLYVQVYDASEILIATYYSQAVLADGWSQVVNRFTVPAGSTQARVKTQGTASMTFSLNRIIVEQGWTPHD